MYQAKYYGYNQHGKSYRVLQNVIRVKLRTIDIELPTLGYTETELL